MGVALAFFAVTEITHYAVVARPDRAIQ